MIKTWAALRAPQGLRRAKERRFLDSLNLGHARRTEIPQQASDRHYYRLVTTGESLIFCDDPHPNATRRRRFAQLSALYSSYGAPVPRLRHSQLQYGFFVFQDLGDTSLASSPGLIDRLPLAIDVLCQIQALDADNFTRRARLDKMDAAYLRRRVDLSLARIHKWMPPGHGETARALSRQTLRRLVELILATGERRCLVHSDFQSTNLLFHQEKCFFIDYQDTKIGPCLHDLASLLEDPQIEITETLRQASLLHYHRTSTLHRDTPLSVLQGAYDHQALLRVYDLIGTYLFLGRGTMLRYRSYALRLLDRLQALVTQTGL